MVTPGPEEFITLVYWTSSQMELRMLMTKETFMKLLPHPQQQLIQSSSQPNLGNSVLRGVGEMTPNERVLLK